LAILSEPQQPVKEAGEENASMHSPAGRLFFGGQALAAPIDPGRRAGKLMDVRRRPVP